MAAAGRPRGLLALLAVLLILDAGFLLSLPGHRYRYLVLHHTASQVDDYASIREFHARRHGWGDAGYHLILSNGSAGVPLGHLEPTGRYASNFYAPATPKHHYNALGLHLCVVGNYSQGPVPAALRPALAHAVAALMKRHRIQPENLVFHRDISSTQCPGLELTHQRLNAWLRGAAGACPESIQAQHEEVVGGGWLPLSLDAGWLWVGLGLANLAVLLLWAWLAPRRLAAPAQKEAGDGPGPLGSGTAPSGGGQGMNRRSARRMDA